MSGQDNRSTLLRILLQGMVQIEPFLQQEICQGPALLAVVQATGVSVKISPIVNQELVIKLEGPLTTMMQVVRDMVDAISGGADAQYTSVDILIPACQLFLLTGRDNEELLKTQAATGAMIHIEPTILPKSTERVCRVSGSPERVTLAVKIMLAAMLDSPPEGSTLYYLPGTKPVNMNLLDAPIPGAATTGAPLNMLSPGLMTTQAAPTTDCLLQRAQHMQAGLPLQYGHNLAQQLPNHGLAPQLPNHGLAPLVYTGSCIPQMPGQSLIPQMSGQNLVPHTQPNAQSLLTLPPNQAFGAQLPDQPLAQQIPSPTNVVLPMPFGSNPAHWNYYMSTELQQQHLAYVSQPSPIAPTDQPLTDSQGGHSRQFGTVPEPSPRDQGLEQLVEEVDVPNEKIGSIIGRGGSRVKSIRETSGAFVTISEYNRFHASRQVTISGQFHQVKMAKDIVTNILENKGSFSQDHLSADGSLRATLSN